MHSQLTVSVAEILGRPGEYRDIAVAEPLAGVRTPLARLLDTPIRGRLRAESVVEGVLVTGRLGGQARLQCARCLTEFAAPVELEVCELFALSPNEDDDAYEIKGTEIGLEPMIRDAMALALPLNPVCDAACRGLCATCGRDLNRGTCDCSTEDVDPRWAPLAVLKEKLEG